MERLEPKGGSPYPPSRRWKPRSRRPSNGLISEMAISEPLGKSRKSTRSAAVRIRHLRLWRGRPKRASRRSAAGAGFLCCSAFCLVPGVSHSRRVFATSYAFGPKCAMVAVITCRARARSPCSNSQEPQTDWEEPLPRRRSDRDRGRVETSSRMERGIAGDVATGYVVER